MYALGDDNSFDFAQALLAFFYILSHFLKGEIPRLSDISLYWVNVTGWLQGWEEWQMGWVTAGLPCVQGGRELGGPEGPCWLPSM